MMHWEIAWWVAISNRKKINIYCKYKKNLTSNAETVIFIKESSTSRKKCQPLLKVSMFLSEG